MSLPRKTPKPKFGPRKRSDQKPVKDTVQSSSSLSQAQPASSAIATRSGNRPHLHMELIRDSARNAQATSGSQQLLSQGPHSGSSETNPRFGSFAGASHVNASHSVFNDVAGDYYHTNIEIKDDELSLLKELPYVKDASYRSGNRDTCLTGTRIDELRRIEEWEADDNNKRVYWLNGMAGTGKSTIAQTFAELSSAKERLGASFFCTRDFDNRRDINLIFPTLAYYLACQYSTFKAALIEILKSTPNAGHETLDLQLKNLLVRPLQSTELSTTIIIDALDECKGKDPASAILSLLGRHVDAMPGVKFFITGRPEIPIRTAFRLPLLRPHAEIFVLHDVDRVSVDGDIKLYLQMRLSEIAAQRSDCEVDVIWPTDEEISLAVTKCSGVFVVASIIVRFVISPNHMPQDRLHVIISRPDSTVNEGKSGLDKTYDQIFLEGFEDVKIDDTDFFNRLRLVLGSIVLAFNPISCTDLEVILDLPPNSVRSTIRSLHSVLTVPESNSRPPRVCHKSFPDYLTDRTRCTDPRFQIDPSIYHLKLGACCLTLMNKALTKNICDLPAYTMNSEVDDLDERRENCIGSGLEYACTSWARHLRIASGDGDNVQHIVKLLELFFRCHLLLWLEVLSILGDLRCAIYSLRDVKAWLADVGLSDTDLSAIVKDSERFVLRFFDAIEASAVHIYHSALPWCPATSHVRMLYQDHIPTEVKINSIDHSWDACIKAIETSEASRIAYSHKDDLIAVCLGGCVDIFEVSTGQRQATYTCDEDNAGYFGLVFSPDDTLIVTGRESGVIDVWDLQTGSLVCALEGHTGLVKSVAFSACGTMIASGSLDYTLRIWDLSSHNCQCVLRGHSGAVESVCWFGAGLEVVSGSRDGPVKVWDVVGRKCLKILTGHPGMSTEEECRVACSPDASLIASSRDNTLLIFEAKSGSISRTISTDGYITSIRFSTPERLMYTTREDTTNCSFVIQWDLIKNAKEVLFTFKHDEDQVAISSDGMSIASSTRGLLKLWQTDITDPNHGESDSHDGSASCVALSGNGQIVASGSYDRSVRLWDATSGHTCCGHINWVKSVTFSPDSRFCASASPRDTIRIWDVHTGTLVSSIGTYSDVIVFSPHGCQLASFGYPRHLQNRTCRLMLWEVRTGKLLAAMEVGRSFYNVAFGVDGTSVILQNYDSVSHRWQISPSPSYNHNIPNDDNRNDLSSLPLVFVPMHDEEQQYPSPSVAPQHYRYDEGSGWILDNQDRRVFWILPDRRGHHDDHDGKKFVFGSKSGKVTIVDFADEQVEHI